MKIVKTYKYPLYPTKEQEKTLNSWIEKGKWIYNLLIQQRQAMYALQKNNPTAYLDAQKNGLRTKGDHTGTFSYDSLHYAHVKKYKEKHPELNELPSICVDRIIEQVKQAYASFYKNLKTKKKRGGFETPKEKNFKDCFSLTCKKAYNSEIMPIGNRIAKVSGFPKPRGRMGLGDLKIRYYRQATGKIVQQTIVQESKKWFLCITTEMEVVDPVSNPGTSVGIDVGTKRTVQMSDGEYKNLPYERMEFLYKKKKRMQRLLKKKKRGSSNYKKEYKKIAKIDNKIANIRHYYLKMFAAEIAGHSFETIVVEDLNITNMTKSASGTLENPGKKVKQKSGLNRVILNSAPFFFKNFLKQKCKESGSTIKEVKAAYTSQMCSKCQHVSPDNRKTQAGFLCVNCGYEANADLNAAINIERKGIQDEDAVQHDDN